MKKIIRVLLCICCCLLVACAGTSINKEETLKAVQTQLKEDINAHLAIDIAMNMNLGEKVGNQSIHIKSSGDVASKENFMHMMLDVVDDKNNLSKNGTEFYMIADKLYMRIDQLWLEQPVGETAQQTQSYEIMMSKEVLDLLEDASNWNVQQSGDVAVVSIKETEAIKNVLQKSIKEEVGSNIEVLNGLTDVSITYQYNTKQKQLVGADVQVNIAMEVNGLKVDGVIKTKISEFGKEVDTTLPEKLLQIYPNLGKR